MSTLQKHLKIKSCFFLINQLINQSIKCFLNGSSAVKNELSLPRAIISSFFHHRLQKTENRIIVSKYLCVGLSVQNPCNPCDSTLVLSTQNFGPTMVPPKSRKQDYSTKDVRNGSKFSLLYEVMVIYLPISYLKIFKYA